MTALTESRRLGVRQKKVGWLACLIHSIRVARERRALARLDDHLLDDVGITRDQFRDEICRPIWGAPTHWRE